MSATDWYSCPICLHRLRKLLKESYKEVTQKEYDLLKYLLSQWEGQEIIDLTGENKKLLEEMQEKYDDKYDLFNPDTEAGEGVTETIRYDSDSGIGKDGILEINVGYTCYSCGANWENNMKINPKDISEQELKELKEEKKNA